MINFRTTLASEVEPEMEPVTPVSNLIYWASTIRFIEGISISAAECTSRSGTAAGSCAGGFGVCCICKFPKKTDFVQKLLLVFLTCFVSAAPGDWRIFRSFFRSGYFFIIVMLLNVFKLIKSHHLEKKMWARGFFLATSVILVKLSLRFFLSESFGTQAIKLASYFTIDALQDIPKMDSAFSNIRSI